MTFVITGIGADEESVVVFHGKFTWRLNLLCTRSILGYALDIGSESSKGLPTGSPGLASLTSGDRPARSAISSPGSALPPNTLLEATQWFIN
jgi:hypothetical protein